MRQSSWDFPAETSSSSRSSKSARKQLEELKQAALHNRWRKLYFRVLISTVLLNWCMKMSMYLSASDDSLLEGNDRRSGFDRDKSLQRSMKVQFLLVLQHYLLRLNGSLLCAVLVTPNHRLLTINKVCRFPYYFSVLSILFDIVNRTKRLEIFFEPY